MFNLNNNKVNLLAPNEGKYAFGFYCPKGFIFVEASHPYKHCVFKDTLRRHSPSLKSEDVTYAITHNSDFRYKTEQLCKLSDYWSTTTFESLKQKYLRGFGFLCIREDIQAMFFEICSSSDWALHLLSKAAHIDNLISDLPWFQEILAAKIGETFKMIEDFNDTGTGELSVFVSIILLEHDLKEKLLYHMRFKHNQDMDSPIYLERLKEILDNHKFWADGRKLKRILVAYILRIPDLMDTFVPTAGYLEMALDKVQCNLFNGDESITTEDEAFTFWQDLDSCLRSNNRLHRIHGASYLNPVYFLQNVVQEESVLLEKVRDCLEYWEMISEEESDKMDEELQRYRDVFSSLSADIELQKYHPVKLWEQYGHDLPLLQKFAIKVLSAPLSCMCNQVKKHVFQLEGADDYVLRLNVRMMEEFRNLGDDIYKPINLDKIAEAM